MFRPRVETFRDIDALARRAAEIFKGQFAYAMSERGRLSVALSRPTPEEAFERIAEVSIPKGAHLFQVDERRAKRGTDDRNRTLIERTLGDWTRAATFHPMPVDGFSLKRGARRYADALADAAGARPQLDLVHLGLGPDGHTASLLPGDPVLDTDDRPVAITRTHGGFRRMTMTYPVLDNARLVVMIVSGREKAEALKRVLDGDRDMPASRLECPNAVVLTDRDAATRI